MAMMRFVGNPHKYSVPGASAILAAVVVAGLAGFSMATAHAAQQGLPELVVQGQRDVFNNNEAKLVTRAQRVSYSDLKLATPSGADDLQKRVSAAAEEVCHQLAALYPPEVSGGFQHTSENCVKDATTNAMEQADKLIAAAKSTNHDAG